MVSRILITGVSGVGKSSIIDQMRKRGYRAIDTDDPGWIELRQDGERIWKEDQLKALFSSLDKGENLIVSGTVINQAKFYSYFDRIILLTAQTSLIKKRIQKRTNNKFGKNQEEWEQILESLEHVEPLLKKGSDIVINTNTPLDVVVNIIIRIFEE